MRIGFVHNLNSGGARRTMAEHMARVEGDVVEVCLATATAVRDDAITIPLQIKAPQLPPALRPPARYRDLAAILRAWHTAGVRLRELALDAVVAHPCQFVQAPPAITAVGPKTLLFCHEVRRVDYEAAAGDRRSPLTRVPYAPMYAAERQADRRAVAAAAVLVTNSQFTAASVRRAYGRGAEVLPLGVADGFTPAPEPAEPMHVLSVGSLIAGKGHDRVIAAAGASRRRWPVVIVAPRPDPDAESELQRQAASAGVALSIRTGITDTELRDLYRTAVATLYLAEAEPFGLVSLEAQACGCPVIVSDEGGLPETLRPGASGWVVPRDPARVAARLDELDDPPLREAFSRAAAAHAAPLTWAASTRALETALAPLTGR